MKAQELRIGNLIIANDVYEGQIKTFERFSDNLKVVFFSDGSHHGIGEYLEDCKPIPLTEEWLFKFGNVKKTKVIQVLEVFERFGFIWKDEYGYWYVVTKSGDYVTKIEFVHEYQNFIFCSTGTELFFNEKNE